MEMISDKLLTEIRSELDQALASVLEARGITAKIGTMHYSANDFRFTVKARLANAPSEEEEDYNRAQFRYNLPPLGTTVLTASGRVLTTVGYLPRSRKYPVLCRDLDGKVYKYRLKHIQDATWDGK